MGGMEDVPTMGYVIIDAEEIIRAMRSHLYFGGDVDHILYVLKNGS